MKLKPIQPIIVLAIILALTFVTGCSNQAKNAKGIGDLTWTTEPGNPEIRRVQTQLDTNLTVDAVIKGSLELREAHIYRACLGVSDKDNITKSFLKDCDIAEKFERDGSVYYETTDGKTLGVGNDIYFHNQRYNYIDQVFGIRARQANSPYGDNLDSYPKYKDLPFMGYAEATEKVRQELASFNLPTLESVEIYALDYQTMREQESLFAEAGLLINRDGQVMLKETWDVSDDCYFMVINLSFDGFPIFSGMYGSGDDKTLVYGSTLWVCYSARGFECLEVVFPYQPISIEQEDQPVISLENALQDLQDKYGNVILTDPTVVTEISLCYVPVLIGTSQKEFHMKPAWCFQVEQKLAVNDQIVLPEADKRESITIYNTVIIDAITGKEII